MGIGKQRSWARRGLKIWIMWLRRFRAADREEAERIQGRSRPLEKNLPWEVVMRTEPGEAPASAFTRDRALRMEFIKDGLSQCWWLPVRVSMNSFPRFSTLHIFETKVSTIVT